mmetsp:Transcript_27494/g.55017  ORF Transcript_27494/g.55017 Transcript_27494/m.55017 type:complete len:118 (+) Transcript_27494:63-416(+)
MKWKPAQFELCIVEELLKTQFRDYVNRVQKADCQAELRRLLASGPPTHVADKHGFPLDDGEDRVERLWFARDGKEQSARLDGSLEGEEREQLWQTLRAFLTEGKDDAEEGSPDDEKV